MITAQLFHEYFLPAYTKKEPQAVSLRLLLYDYEFYLLSYDALTSSSPSVPKSGAAPP
jgi:hypothetical protein